MPICSLSYVRINIKIKLNLSLYKNQFIFVTSHILIYDDEMPLGLTLWPSKIHNGLIGPWPHVSVPL